MIRTLFLLLILVPPVSTSMAQSNEVESTHKVLVALYNSTNGDGWKNNTGWNINTVPTSMEAFGQWHGLTISDGDLALVDLRSNNLHGTLPPELGKLSDLERLWLGDNQLEGEIPPEFGNLSDLENLHLGGNQLTGKIPPQLGNLSDLQGLYLQGNQFTGEIPPQLGNLSDLQGLSLQENQLTGEIPSELAKLPDLERLWLDENQLTGGIPPQLGNLSDLQRLSLSHNQLTGRIPSQLGNLSDLQRLYLQGNQLTDGIPPQLGNLSDLQELSLKENQLTGGIPSQLGRLSNLERLWLDENQLTGKLPPELGNLSNLQWLYLSSNQLTGEIPRSFLRLRTLQGLFLPDGICAPQDDEFQAWLNRLSDSTVRKCGGVSFAGGINNQSYPRTRAISPLILPEAATGTQPITYTLTPTLPQGLSFDASTRTISGTPMEVMPPVTYTYRATDAQNSTDSLRFSIEVYSPVSAEQDALPAEFAVHANYPNPFRHSTRLVFDLPRPAQVQIKVMDVTGRQVFTRPPENFSAGRGREIELNGLSLPSGPYLYRLTATSTESISIYIGRFVRIR